MGKSFVCAKLGFLIFLCFIFSMGVQASPSGGQITFGSASISQQNNAMTIYQGTNQAIVNWNSFSILPSESVQFVQPSTFSATLNRVIGVNPSLIQGTLKANGQLFLLNPNGILFGPTAVVNAGGIIASTLNLSDQDFLSGQYHFSQNSNTPLGAIVNQGTLQTTPQGAVVLVAPLVDNEGAIVANTGQVRLGAGTQAFLNFDGKGYVNFVVQTANAVPQNVTLNPNMVTSLIQQVVNNHDVVEAGSVSIQNGAVTLLGAEGTMINGGRVSARGTDFQTGGDVILNSSQATYLSPNSFIDVSGQGIASSGGNLHIFSNGNTLTSLGSQLISQGGSTGNGGFIDVSAQNNLLNNATIDTSAINGTIGTFLLDPTTLTILDGRAGTLNASLPNVNFNTVSVGILNTITTSALETQLSNIVLQATNSITVNNITTNGGNIPLQSNVSIDLETKNGNITFANPANTLTTSGTGSIMIHAGETAASGGQAILGNLTSTGTGAITVLADGNIGFGTITSAAAVTLNSTNGAILSAGGTQILTTSLSLSSKTGIGSLLSPLGTSVPSLSASTSASNAPIYLSNAIPLSNLVIATENSDTKVQLPSGQSLSFSGGTELLNNLAIGANLSFTNANGDIALGLVNVGSNSTAILNASGAITSGNSGVNLIANSARLNAGTSLGTINSPLNTSVGTLTATALNGSINLVNTGDLLLGTINSAGGINLASSGSIFDNSHSTITNLIALGNSTLLSQGVLGTASDPLLVHIQGNLSVTANGIQDGTSVVINGSVIPSNILTLLNAPPGNVFFDGGLFRRSAPIETLLQLAPLLTFQGTIVNTAVRLGTDTLEVGEPTQQKTDCRGSVTSMTINFAAINSGLTKTGNPCP